TTPAFAHMSVPFDEGLRLSRRFHRRCGPKNTPTAMKSWKVKWLPVGRPSITTLEMYVGPASENETYRSAGVERRKVNLSTGNTDSVRKPTPSRLLHSEKLAPR